MKNNILFALDANFNLAKRVAEHSKKNLIIPEVAIFADGEVRIELPKDIAIKGSSAFVIHSTADPVNENYMKLFFLIDLLKRNGAQDIVVVVPYFGYARQCCCKEGQNIGHAKIVVQMLELSGATLVSVVEVHDTALESFFTIDFENILLRNFIADHIKKTSSDLENCCLIAADEGAKERVEQIASLLQVDSFCFSKKRSGINKVEIVDMQDGDLKGKHVILIDDIIDTGSTALQVIDALSDMHVDTISAYFVHPVLSNNAAQKLQKSAVDKIFITNSIELKEDKNVDKIEVLDISSILLRSFLDKFAI